MIAARLSRIGMKPFFRNSGTITLDSGHYLGVMSESRLHARSGELLSGQPICLLSEQWKIRIFDRDVRCLHDDLTGSDDRGSLVLPAVQCCCGAEIRNPLPAGCALAHRAILSTQTADDNANGGLSDTRRGGG